ncbi:MAG: hypothetical protein KBS70_06065 [Bacteroidales bacterium]|nr:hypothetical protein [Candidatus Colicola equi]
MRKICKFCLTLVAILACTNVFGSGACINIGGVDICDVPYYGKVSAHVSSKYSGGGKVYVHSSAVVDEQNMNFGPVAMPTLDKAEAAAISEGYENWPIYTLHPILEMGSSQPDTAWLFAFPAPGYYFKGWSKVDNDYELGTENPLTPSVLSMAIPEPDMEGEQLRGVKWPTEDQIPSIGSFYATFRPVLVNSGEDYVGSVAVGETNSVTFPVHFSTSYGTSENDFETPTFDNGGVVAGCGTFAVNSFTYTKETGDVEVSVTFIPATQMLEKTYSCPLTFASKGGSYGKANISMEVEAASENEAVVKNGTTEKTYQTFIEAWFDAAEGSTIILKKNVNLDSEIDAFAEQIGTTALPVTKNITLDLNGKTLTGSKPQMIAVVGGKLTLKDSKKIGYISHAPSAIPAYSVLVAGGEFVMDGGSIELDNSNPPEDIDPNDVEQIKANMTVAVLVSPNTVPGVTGPASFTMNDGRIYAQAPGVVGGVMNNGGTATINAGEIYSTGYMGVLAASNMPEGTLNILGGNLQAELKDDYGTATMAYGVLAFGGTINIEKAKIIAKAGDNLYDQLYGVCCPFGTTTISKKATIGIEYTQTSDPDKAHCCIGAMHVEKDMATATLDGAKLYARGNNGYTEEFSNNSAPTINAAYFPTRIWLDKIDPDHFVIRDDQTLYDVSAGKEYLEGYRYFLGSAGTAKDNGNAVCKIGNMGYATLEDALFYAQNNPTENVIITMVNDYTLPAGWYTLPSNASLLVPYCAEQTALMGKNVKKLAAGANPTPPTPYKTLTIASGAHIDAFGSIEVSCMQRIEGMGADGCAVPDGPFGWIKMEQGSEITLNSGAHLYAWGFVTGKGEIEARRGCTVHEDFQVYDWDGGTNAMNAVLNAKNTGAGVFPITQYAMQNIECPVTYHPGSHMYASFGATALGLQVAADEIGIVGVNEEAEEHPAMFLMNTNADADNTWVRKYYDTETDQQVYEVNSSAHLGSMVIDIPIFKMVGAIMPQFAGLTGFDSKGFVLPITSNMKLHLLSGMMDITQNTEFLPGSELEVNKTSTMIVQYDPTKVYTGRVIFVDDDDWNDNFGFSQNGTPYKQIAYSPTFGGAPNIRDIGAMIEGDGHRHYDPNKRPVGDAKLNVHGTFQVDGFLLTTDSGATIFSNNEDAGTIIFPNEFVFIEERTDVAAPTDGMIEQIKQQIALLPDDNEMKKIVTSMIYVPHLNMYSNATELLPLKSALLRNTEGQTPAFANTGDDTYPTLPGESYCFLRDRWTKMDQFDANFAYDNYGAWYVKPGEYVAIATTEKEPEGYFKGAKVETQPLENADHTYSDANGEGRLFILVYNEDKGGDQCWEVTIQDNLYRGTNGTYYYYDETQKMWMEKTFSVTWNNYDGEQCGEVYKLYYGTTPKYNGLNPSREKDDDYTYTFTGWTPEIVPVHEDAIYTATYERSPRKYTIIFEAENGEEIERHFYTKGEMPECEDVPHKVGYYLQWEPSLGAVKGDATYRATFLPEKPTEFEVTFVNYDGTELQSEPVAVDVIPDYTGETPTKQATDEYEYEFAGWSPELKPVDAAITYTATFNEVGKTYAIRFLDENGAELQSEMLAYGVVPTAPEYSKPADAEFTYTLVWSPTITAVNKAQDYEANFTPTTNKYTVTVNAIGCVVEGAGAYDYGTEVTLHIVGALEGYENAQWEDGTTEDKEFIVTGNVTYAASATPVADKTLVVEDEEMLTLTKETRVAAFTIQANSETSGQIINADQYLELTGAGQAYFEYDFNAQAMKWYAFAVPFVCDANTLRNATRTLTPGVDYDIMEYNGATRAAAGADDSAWEYISDKGINVLTPGHLYMILFAQAQNTITFTKTASASIVYTAPVTMNQYPAVDDLNANWNGVANPKLFYANLGTGVTYGQMYVSSKDRYDKVRLSTTTFPVGKPVFVQASNTQSQVIVTPSVSAAPLRRMLKADKQECEISLMQGNKECDNLSIIMNDEAEDRYVIGEDLAKAGVSTKVAQMWINRYNAKLCVNSIAAEDEVATFPLGISAPKAGAYTIAAASVPANTAVYLTEDDNIIADLTVMPYTLDLSKGTHNEFGLRMVGKTQPSVVTDFREAGINGKEVQKVIKNNTLYILRADKVFNAQGQLVK